MIITPVNTKIVPRICRNEKLSCSIILEKKIEAIRAFKSQFFDPNNPTENTYISSPEFLKFLEARSREVGHFIGVEFGEGFTTERHIGVRNLFNLV